MWHLATLDGRIGCGLAQAPSLRLALRLELAPHGEARCARCERAAARLEREGRLLPAPPTAEQLAEQLADAREQRRAQRLARWLDAQRRAA